METQDVKAHVLTDLNVLQIGMWWLTDHSGGLDRVFVNLVQNLPAAGVDVSGLVEGPENVSVLTDGKVKSFGVAAGGMLTRGRVLRAALARQLADEKPHVIAVHFALYAALARRATRSRPLVMHFHGPWSREAEHEGAARHVVMAKRLVEQSIYHRADRIIVVSRAFGELICREYGVDAEKVRLVSGAIDTDRFDASITKSAARIALGWPEDRPILLAVRRLSHRMGLDRLLTAMLRVVAAVPDVLLFIAGKGALFESLHQQILDTGLEHNVRMLGYVPDPDLPIAYRAADFNVVPTLALEGFGLVAAEAMACGTPSLVTPIGGLPEVVSPLSSNLVFRSTKSDDMADTLIAALRGDVKLPNSANCRAYVTENFTAQAAAKGAAQVYRELH